VPLVIYDYHQLPVALLNGEPGLLSHRKKNFGNRSKGKLHLLLVIILEKARLYPPQFKNQIGLWLNNNLSDQNPLVYYPENALINHYNMKTLRIIYLIAVSICALELLVFLLSPFVGPLGIFYLMKTGMFTEQKGVQVISVNAIYYPEISMSGIWKY